MTRTPMPSDAPSTRREWRSLIAWSLCLGLLGWILWRPLYGTPEALPDRIRAVEGDVQIPTTWRDADEPYVLRTADGRQLALHCGPRGYRVHCLDMHGLEPGSTYRLTLAYGSETLPDGSLRNVITHAVFDGQDLVTPQDQAWAWGDRNGLDRFIRESDRSRRSSGLVPVFLALALGALCGFLTSAFRLTGWDV